MEKQERVGSSVAEDQLGMCQEHIQHISTIITNMLGGLDEEGKNIALNQLRNEIMKHSPHHEHPVDCIQWVPAALVYANDYNPNHVAPPEKQLLHRSVEANGYTQPIVVWQTEEGYEVIDGYHRHQVGLEIGLTHLPVVVINADDTGRGDRIAATIRHNRARGKHQVGAMSDIVVELSRRNWSDKKIAKELGMDQDEVLRLKQITGLAELFAEEEFSEAWE